MTEHNQKLVADLRSEATIFPMGCMHELLLQAAASIESLSNDSHLINASNKLLNDKCERLMGENKGLKEQVHSLEDRIGRLDEIIKSREARIDELLKQLGIAQIPGNIRLCEENANLKEQLAAANDATVSRDATIKELREDVRRIGVESNDFRNRMIREQTLVSQLAAALEGLSNRL